MNSDNIHVPLIPECSSCILNSLQTLIPILSEDKKKQSKLLSHVFKKLAEGYEKNLEPVILSIRLFQELYELGDNLDPYKEIKWRSIQAAEKALPEVEREIDRFDGFEKLRAALAASIAGNLIDFNTAYHQPDLSDLVNTFRSIQSNGFEIDDSEALWTTLKEKKGVVVFLADNAGETNFDIPLLRVLREHEWEITYVVKQKPMINDATHIEIEGTEIPKLAGIADNGAWAHGVPKSMVSEEFLDLVRNAELVISKGQANIETFPEIQREIGVETYYVLRAKCPHIASAIKSKVGDNVILRKP